MKTILLATITVLFSLSAFALTDLERDNLADEAREKRYAEVQAKINKLTLGMTTSQVEDLFGTPDSNDAVNGSPRRFYELNRQPYIMTFSPKGLLTGWTKDVAEIMRRENKAAQADAETRAQLAEIEATKRAKSERIRAAGAFMYSSSRPKNVNCVTNKVGNTAFTKCN